MMTTDPQNLIARARDVCQGATPGPLSGRTSLDSSGLWNITDKTNFIIAHAMMKGDANMFSAAPDLLMELAKALEAALWEVGALRASIVLHPDGKCACYGEGRCDFCRRCHAEIELDETKTELADHKAMMVGLLADAYEKGRQFNEDTDDRTSEDD